jgi:hypothetical protein
MVVVKDRRPVFFVSLTVVNEVHELGRSVTRLPFVSFVLKVMLAGAALTAICASVMEASTERAPVIIASAPEPNVTAVPFGAPGVTTSIEHWSVLEPSASSVELELAVPPVSASVAGPIFIR